MKKELADNIESLLKGNDLEFARRIWNADNKVYHDRVNAIGFTNMHSVLDAGCGFGQWSFPLAELNSNVMGIDYSDVRIKFCNSIKPVLTIKDNVDFRQGSIEDLPFSDNSFDGIFCYSVLYLTNYFRSLNEFYRVLKPGGKLYFVTNGIGWYLYSLIEERNKSGNYNPRVMAADTINESLNNALTKEYRPNHQLVMPSYTIKKYLAEKGFADIRCGYDGQLSLNASVQSKSFYPRDYLGYEMVYEILTLKPV